MTARGHRTPLHYCDLCSEGIFPRQIFGVCKCAEMALAFHGKCGLAKARGTGKAFRIDCTRCKQVLYCGTPRQKREVEREVDEQRRALAPCVPPAPVVYAPSSAGQSPPLIFVVLFLLLLGVIGAVFNAFMSQLRRHEQ